MTRRLPAARAEPRRASQCPSKAAAADSARCKRPPNQASMNSRRAHVVLADGAAPREADRTPGTSKIAPRMPKMTGRRRTERRARTTAQHRIAELASQCLFRSHVAAGGPSNRGRHTRRCHGRRSGDHRARRRPRARFIMREPGIVLPCHGSACRNDRS